MHASAIHSSMPGMDSFATDSNPWEKIVEDSYPERESSLDVFKERYRCRKLGKSFSRRVQPLRNLGSETQHPWLLMLLLTAADTIHFILVGIQMLPLLLLIIALIATWGLVFVGSYRYVFQFGERDNVDWLTTEDLHRMSVFVIITVLFALFKQFCSCFCSVLWLELLIDKADEIFVPFGFIICFALFVIRNFYLSLLGMALNFAFLYVLTFLLNILVWSGSCFLVLSRYIPWYVLVPLTGLLFIFLIAFLRHICTSCRKPSGSTRSDCQDVNSNGELQNPQDSKPPEYQASESCELLLPEMPFEPPECQASEPCELLLPEMPFEPPECQASEPCELLLPEMPFEDL